MRRFWATLRDVVPMTIWFSMPLQCFSDRLFLGGGNGKERLLALLKLLLDPYWCHLRGQKHFSGSLSVHRQGVEDTRPSGYLVIPLACSPAAYFSQAFRPISAGTARKRKGRCKPSSASGEEIKKHQFWVAFCY